MARERGPRIATRTLGQSGWVGQSQCGCRVAAAVLLKCCVVVEGGGGGEVTGVTSLVSPSAVTSATRFVG